MDLADTKTKILDSAEKLFAAKGFAATSLRNITSEANVNLAAINYHFDSKDKLIYEVFARRMIPINKERIRLLDEIEAKNVDQPPHPKEIVRALVAPLLRAANNPDLYLGDILLRLFARLHIESEEKMREMFKGLMGAVIQRFIKAFRKSLPDLEEADFFWRVYFMIGVMAHSVDTQKLNLISHGCCDTSDVEGIIDRMVNFITPGLLAPGSKKE